MRARPTTGPGPPVAESQSEFARALMPASGGAQPRSRVESRIQSVAGSPGRMQRGQWPCRRGPESEQPTSNRCQTPHRSSPSASAVDAAWLEPAGQSARPSAHRQSGRRGRQGRQRGRKRRLRGGQVLACELGWRESRARTAPRDPKGELQSHGEPLLREPATPPTEPEHRQRQRQWDRRQWAMVNRRSWRALQLENCQGESR